MIWGRSRSMYNQENTGIIKCIYSAISDEMEEEVQHSCLGVINQSHERSGTICNDQKNTYIFLSKDFHSTKVLIMQCLVDRQWWSCFPMIQVHWCMLSVLYVIFSHVTLSNISVSSPVVSPISSTFHLACC
jgi:hypothetical protein